ncbi:MAG: M3 family metallopeptidase [bacterium]|nr:M3 family metallopeptidase [bacterium]
MERNPILERNELECNALPFDKIKKEHYIPAVKESLEKAQKQIEAIKTNCDKPDFGNTLVELEKTIEKVENVFLIYQRLYEVESDDVFKDLDNEISPLESDFFSKLYTDKILYGRINEVFNNRESFNLDNQDIRLLANYHNRFIRNGALLSDTEKKKIQGIDNQLSTLSGKFSKNAQNEKNSFSLHITDVSRLEGIPKNVMAIAKEKAIKKGEKEGWVFTLDAAIAYPVEKYAKDREIRQIIGDALYKGSVAGENDNRDLILKMITLKNERAKLLGFETSSHYVISDRMAKDPAVVMDFLQEIKEKALPIAKKEVEELAKYAKELDGIEHFERFDCGYYSEKLKKEKYNFDDELLRPYFELGNVLDGLFKVTENLFDVSFEEIHNVPVYHKDVKTYKVFDKERGLIGLIYFDLFPRETKEDLAWSDPFRPHSLIEGEKNIPLVLLACNFPPVTKDSPSLLNLDEANTLFHEMGHALHDLFSEVKYASIGGQEVLYDFVELPSQILENWLLEEETLQLFARHYETGEMLPQEYIEKIKKSRNYNTGMNNLRQIKFGLLDLNWYLTNPDEIKDVEEFENSIVESFQLFPKRPGNMSTNFGHIFGGGYESGYYSYKWAEILDADAFELFLEKGIFHKETARSFKENILSKGNSEHPMELYKRFRGREPRPEAFFKREGLLSK